MSKKIGVVSLGCDKNRVDTEKMLWYLSDGDYEVTADYADADIIIVNTCAFIESARKEAIETILEMAKYKTDGKCKKLIATGCLVEKYRAELEKEMPEVDAFLGIGEYEKIRACIGEDVPAAAPNDDRILTTPPHYAYMRIADGCDNFCTFCTIPSIRGKYRSRTLESLSAEAKKLAGNGVKELILVAQDVTSYGKDLYGKPSLLPLLRELTKYDFKWIRLMYCYPELVTDELIDEIAANPKIAKYIDIPMQHVSDSVLKRMNRRSNYAELCVLCEKLKNHGIALRTTFMVGFPGETEENFKLLVDFAKKYKPENLGVFAFSKEDGTPAARLKGQLPKAEKLKRVKALGKLNLENVKELNASLVDSVVEVVYEDVDYDRGMFKGRTQFNAPEIDKNVYFTGDFADVGCFYKVKITGYDEYDLIGELLNESTD